MVHPVIVPLTGTNQTPEATGMVNNNIFETGMSIADKWTQAFFNATCPRTAGFSSVDLTSLSIQLERRIESCDNSRPKTSTLSVPLKTAIKLSEATANALLHTTGRRLGRTTNPHQTI